MKVSSLKLGSTGEFVIAWQRFLIEQGFQLDRVDGKFGPKTDEATRRYQSAHGLDVDGKVGPKTFAQALANGFTLIDDDDTDDEGDEDDADGHGGALGTTEDDDLGSVRPDPDFAATIEDRRDFGALRLPSKKVRGPRRASDVTGLVLHQMGFSRGNDLRRYDGVTAHYVIMPDGQIGWLHEHEKALHASDKGFNPTTVACEFAGNLPSIRGRWHKPDLFGTQHLTPRQVSAGRFLVKHLANEGVITQVFAHIQAGGANRGNCPGPDIWSSVGQWAVQKLGLSDGGPGHVRENSSGMGLPIPDAWRTWGRR
jgi:hypothetical protein